MGSVRALPSFGRRLNQVESELRRLHQRLDDLDAEVARQRDELISADPQRTLEMVTAVRDDVRDAVKQLGAGTED